MSMPLAYSESAHGRLGMALMPFPVTDEEKHAILRMLLAAQYKDNDTGVHCLRIGALSAWLARLMGETEGYATRLLWAAPLHDIGKIAIPDRILQKPGKLTDEERKIMHTHSVMGKKLLGDATLPTIALAAEIAGSHHEKFDGTGYPDGLRGTQIPFSGRLVSVVDVFDAITMRRCYREAHSNDEAIELIARLVAAHFDPMIADVFIDHADEFAKLKARLDNVPVSATLDYTQLGAVFMHAQRCVAELANTVG